MPISRSTTIACPPEKAYALVSDLPRMGELSPENVGGRWLGAATGPAEGARFKGSNRHGWRRWRTTVRVAEAAPGRAFVFDVSSFRVPVARWSYAFAATPDGCAVTESWEDRRPFWFKGPAGLATGVMDREAATATSIEHTLGRLKAALEA